MILVASKGHLLTLFYYLNKLYIFRKTIKLCLIVPVFFFVVVRGRRRRLQETITRGGKCLLRWLKRSRSKLGVIFYRGGDYFLSEKKRENQSEKFKGGRGQGGGAPGYRLPTSLCVDPIILSTSIWSPLSLSE